MVLQNSFDQKLVDGLSVELSGSSTGDIYFRNSAGQFTRLPVGGVGQLLTVSAGLLPVWQAIVLANGSVTLSQLQSVQTGRFLGRSSAGSGTIEELDPATARTLLGLGSASLASTGTGSGNVPVLDAAGKLSSSVIPSIALTSIQIVANQAARLALSNVEQGDCAKQSDNGITYVLAALPASTDSNWVSIGDTAIDASEIVSGFISPARLGTGTPSSTSVLTGSQQYVTLGQWAFATNQVVSANTTLSPNTTCDANGVTAGTPIVLTLPTTASAGSIIEITGTGVGGWRVAQNAGQQIHFGTVSSTVGTGGSIASTHFRNCVRLKCITANTTWQVQSSQGVLDVT
jgi:hypothetical protein